MTYDTDPYYLVITVVNNIDFVESGQAPKFLRVLTITDGKNVKRDSFNKTFNAGSLTINKETVGNYADPDVHF